MKREGIVFAVLSMAVASAIAGCVAWMIASSGDEAARLLSVAPRTSYVPIEVIK